MKVRNIVRKAATVGASGLMLGATVMGAVAYDFADFPNEKFIVDGVFDGNFVIGEKAATADLLSVVDMAGALQGASVSKVSVPGATGKKELLSEGFELQTGSDRLEIRENIGDVVDTVSEYELPGLKSGKIVTSEGDTDFFQYLRFKDGSNLQNMTVNYVEDDDNNMGTFLVVETDLPFMEWEIQFPEGLESDLDTASDELDDLEDKSFNIMGTDFTIVQAMVEGDGTDFEMILMGGSIPDTLREGETRTYSIDGVDYEVTLVFVSDPNQGTSEAKLSVNGELTQALEEGETDTLSNGLQVGIRDVLTNAREGVVSFFIGAEKIEMTDPNVNNSDAFDGDIEINNENINDGELDVQGSFVSSDKFEITDIKYRLTMDADKSSTAYIPPGHGMREFMDRPESLISDTLDVYFAGLEEVETNPFEIVARGDDEYEVIFTNIQGRTYQFPYVSNENGAWKFGDDDDDFILVECTNQATHCIGDDDYFTVSNNRGAGDEDKSVSNVLRFEDYDNTDFTLELEDLSTGSTVNVPVNTNGLGSLVIGGHTYQVNVSNRSADQPNINVDLNADGDVASDVVKLTTWGGVVVDLVANVVYNSTLNLSSSAGGVLNDYMTNGGTLEDTSDQVTDQSITNTMQVLAKNFDTSTADGLLNWTVSEDTSQDQVDLNVLSNQYSGPLVNGVPGEAGEFQFEEPSDDEDDWQFGMTDFGILVKEYDPDDSDEPNELLLEIPSQQRFAQVFVTLGGVETGDAGGLTTTVVNSIGVGAALLDRDAPALGSGNMIVVGGPCANTVAAELLGNPENCGEGFEPGKAMLRAWDYGDTAAILVAGYEAEETTGAGRVLASWEDYDLTGSEIEVVVADLNSITVNPVFADSSADDDGEDMA